MPLCNILKGLLGEKQWSIWIWGGYAGFCRKGSVLTIIFVYNTNTFLLNRQEWGKINVDLHDPGIHTQPRHHIEINNIVNII